MRTCMYPKRGEKPHLILPFTQLILDRTQMNTTNKKVDD